MQLSTLIKKLQGLIDSGTCSPSEEVVIYGVAFGDVYSIESIDAMTDRVEINIAI